jgi:hypothetical protein
MPLLERAGVRQNVEQNENRNEKENGEIDFWFGVNLSSIIYNLSSQRNFLLHREKNP